MNRGGFRGGPRRGERGGPRRGRGGVRGGVTEAKPGPTIILKPRPVAEDADGEDWPSIPQASARPASTMGSSSATASPAREASSRSAPRPPGLSAEPSGLKRREEPPPKVADGEPVEMKMTCRLITDFMEWSEALATHLTDNPDFRVIAALGPSGAGKSTLLSMLAGSDAYDMYRTYAFRPELRETSESGRHQTTGVDVYVTPTRRVLIDTQAVVGSASLPEELVRLDKRYSYQYKTVENFAEMEALEIGAWTLAVSEVVLAVTDSFPDLGLLRYLRTAAMLTPVTSDPLGKPHLRRPHLVFVQTKARPEEFVAPEIAERCDFLRRFLEGVREFSLHGGVNIAKGPTLGDSWRTAGGLSDEEAEVSYFPLPELKLRGQLGKAGLSGERAATLAPSFESALSDFRLLVKALPAVPLLPPGPVTLTEAAWLKLAGKMWEEIRKSHLMAEFGRLLT